MIRLRIYLSITMTQVEHTIVLPMRNCVTMRRDLETASCMMFGGELANSPCELREALSSTLLLSMVSGTKLC
jgi:hypothetical protein